MTATARRAALTAARKAAGHTQESLAGALFVDRKTVIRWESGDSAPWPYLWPKLARVLNVTPERLQALFEPTAGSEVRASNDALDAACAWLDQRANWSQGTTSRKVAARVAKLDARSLWNRHLRRTGVGRSDVVRALTNYYGTNTAALSLYGTKFANKEIETSIITRSEWLDLRCPLMLNGGNLTIAERTLYEAPPLAGSATRAVIERLTEASVLDVRITDAQLYRLLGIDAQPCVISGTVGLVPFIEYALTTDLLESELLDALTNGTVTQQAKLPLRDTYLPDLSSVIDLSGRACVGGVLALCAIARPADANRSSPDYALLVQKRSDHVLNAPGRLSVIPKGFHRPLTDHRADARIGSTLRRELEEELFGRVDLDNTLGESRAADPMHLARLSEPMRWLTESGALRMECTGFGLNLVSGNYEFASLIVIEDDEFWRRYGGSVEANWETTGLRPYSSMDRSAVADLIAEEAWSSEGLFAFLQGLRRLNEHGSQRINLSVPE